MHQANGDVCQHNATANVEGDKRAMIYGKLQQIVTVKAYGPKGEFLGESAKYIYKPVLLWRDVFIGLFMAFIIGAQLV